jgi:hypothetical protein
VVFTFLTEVLYEFLVSTYTPFISSSILMTYATVQTIKLVIIFSNFLIRPSFVQTFSSALLGAHQLSRVLTQTLSCLTMPMNAPFNVHMKLQLGTPFRPSLLTTMTVMLPPEPAITVLLITRAISSLSPGLVMDPSVPPLNARNPAIRIMPPRPVSYKADEK